MKYSAALLFLFFSIKLVVASENDTIINLRKGAPTLIKPDSILQEREPEWANSYTPKLALSLDAANFLTSNLFLTGEIPIHKNYSIILQYGMYIYGGINVNDNSKVTPRYDSRNNLYGLGFRAYLNYLHTHYKSPIYIQPQAYIGDVDVETGKNSPKYENAKFNAYAVNIGYCERKHSGIFYGVDAGLGYFKIKNKTDFGWYRIGLEVGYCF